MLKKIRYKSTSLRILGWLFASLILICGNAFAAASSPVGYWRTIDDHSGKARSIVKIWNDNGQLKAKIEKIYYEKGESTNDVCKLCTGKNRNKKILGMTIMWKMVGSGDHWSGGQILDPKNGKSYKCKLTLTDQGAKLKVRGYIGISLLGRTQVWQRVKKVG